MTVKQIKRKFFGSFILGAIIGIIQIVVEIIIPLISGIDNDIAGALIMTAIFAIGFPIVFMGVGMNWPACWAQLKESFKVWNIILNPKRFFGACMKFVIEELKGIGMGFKAFAWALRQTAENAVSLEDESVSSATGGRNE